MPIYDTGTGSPWGGIQGQGGTGVSSGQASSGGGVKGLSNPFGPSPEAAAAMKKTYRPDLGLTLTDAEYRQQLDQRAYNLRQQDADRARAAQSAAQTASQQQAAQQNQQQQASYNNAAMAGLGSAGPQTSNYTGTPTSPIEADRAKLLLEQEFAARQLQNQSSVQSQEMKDSASLQAEAEARRLGYMPQIMAGLPGMVSHGSGASGQQEEAARAAAFARAKEQAGGTAMGALRGLEDYSAGRGQTGSSMERRMIGDVVGGAAGQINEFSRDQLIADLQRAAQLSDLEYQGNITQRGQNLALTPSLLGLVGARAVY